MKFMHDCRISRPNFPSGVNRIETTGRCVECGQYWLITVYAYGGSKMERWSPPWPNPKKFLWKRRMKKEMRS